jgi:multimeric flavodoxin WrbA
MTAVRKGQWPGKMSRELFHTHFQRSFYDPAFDEERAVLARLEEIAWDAYVQGRKAPKTEKAGEGFVDPGYELSVEWRKTRDALIAAEKRQKDKDARSRVLIIIGAARNDGTCPGEISKSFRLANVAEEVFRAGHVDVDRIDLSELSSGYGRKIHPCKSCVSTAMPLCHWPCSCYPNHSLGQSDDWMAEIYEKWTSAHAILIVTPVYWGQSPSGLKLMIDRMVCADGGNPDPTSTGGKDPEKAKEIELRGWNYPKHLAGRVYGVVVHGDVAGAQQVRGALCDWLDWSGLIDAGRESCIDRYIGYWQPYATSHDALDEDVAVVKEVRNVARAICEAVSELRAGTLSIPDAKLTPPRMK